MGGTASAVARTVDAPPDISGRRPRALLPERVRALRRPVWWQELIFVGICYELYSLVRNAVPAHEHSAFAPATLWSTSRVAPA